MKNKFLLLAIGIAFTTQIIIAQVPSFVPTNGLIAYYPFNGNANDESSNGNNGTVNGASLTTDRFGRINNAYQYVSGASLICTNNSFANPNSISYSVWFKSNSQIPGHLIGFNNGQCLHGFTWDRALWVESDKIVFYTYNLVQVKHQVNISLMDDIWHHCVVTMDSIGSKIYIDGVLVSNNSNQNIGQNNFGYFRFGGLSPNNLNNSLIGSIDDIGIWNRALTNTEVQMLYSSQLSVKDVSKKMNLKYNKIAKIMQLNLILESFLQVKTQE
jgi:hypothetical protein